MKLGLNGSTTDQCNLIEDIEVAKTSGFDLLELRTYKIDAYLEGGGTLPDLKAAFEENGVNPYAINALEFFTLKETEAEEKQMLEEAEKWCTIAAAINCPYIVAVPSLLKGQETREEIIDDAVEGLHKLATIGKKHGVSIAFEFIGVTGFSVSTLALANEIVNRVHDEYVGLVVDTYHFHLGGSTIESVQAVDKEKIFIFHVNDAEAGFNKHELNDSHRIFPGLGTIQLESIGKAFKEIGYNEMISLELFRADYWKMDKNELGKEAYKYMKKIAERMFN